MVKEQQAAPKKLQFSEKSKEHSRTLDYGAAA
jgi:hypothetical protein